MHPAQHFLDNDKHSLQVHVASILKLRFFINQSRPWATFHQILQTIAQTGQREYKTVVNKSKLKVTVKNYKRKVKSDCKLAWCTSKVCAYSYNAIIVPLIKV